MLRIDSIKLPPEAGMGTLAAEAARLADAMYGGRRVCAAVQRGNVVGTQFHPEKSGPVGLAILEGYLGMCKSAADS